MTMVMRAVPGPQEYSPPQPPPDAAGVSHTGSRGLAVASNHSEDRLYTRLQPGAGPPRKPETLLGGPGPARRLRWPFPPGPKASKSIESRIPECASTRVCGLPRDSDVILHDRLVRTGAAVRPVIACEKCGWPVRPRAAWRCSFSYSITLLCPSRRADFESAFLLVRRIAA